MALTALAFGVLAGPAAAAPKSKIRFSSGSYFVGESDGEATITVVRTRNLKAPASARLTTAPGTATPGTDYTSVDRVVDFPALAPGDTSKSQAVAVKVPITSDSAVEGNETVSLLLRPTTTTVAGRSSAILTILDDDGAPRVSFATTAFDAAENSGTATVELVRAGDLSSAASVGYSATGGTAPAGDYSLPPGTVSFAAGEGVKTITIGLTDNALVDGTRTVALGLNTPVGTTLADPVSSTLTITDDESPSVIRFETSATTVDEAAGVAYLTVTRVGSYTGQAVTVDYTTTAGTALAPDDFTATSGTLTLDGPDPDIPGDPGDPTGLIEVPIIDDTLQESDETFTATLSAPSANALLGAPLTQTVTIAANDAPPVEPVTTVSPVTTTSPEPATPVTTTSPDPATPVTTTSPDPAALGPATVGPAAGAPLRVGLRILRGKALRRGRVRARVTCSQACALTVGGRLKAVHRKAAKLRTARRTVAAGRPVLVTLKLSRKQKRQLAGHRARLTVSARATAAAGQSAGRVRRSRKLRLAGR